MKVIIFNDKDNLDGSLNLLNKQYPKGKRRFWDYKIYLPFLLQKLKELEGFKNEELELKKTFFYTGKYNSRLINKVIWNCREKIKSFEEIINKEKYLLEEIEKSNLNPTFSRKIKNHVNQIIEIFEDKKEKLLAQIEKQKRNFNGQKNFFKRLYQNPSIEVRTTPLKHADCEVYQKGVDGKIVADLVNLGHTNSYDIAFILGGDTDLIEAIKLVKDSLSKIVVVVACHDPKNPLNSNISDVKGECDYFMNLHDYSKELFEISESLRKNNES